MGFIGLILLVLLLGLIIYVGVIVVAVAAFLGFLIWIAVLLMGISATDPGLGTWILIALAAGGLIMYHRLVVVKALREAANAKKLREHEEYLQKRSKASWYNPRYW